MHRYERLLIRRYAGNLLGHFARARKLTFAMGHWLALNARLLGIGTTEIPELDAALCFDEHEPLSKEHHDGFRPALLALRREEDAPQPSPLQQRLAWLAEILSLGEQDAQTIGAAVRFLVLAPLRDLAGACEGEANLETSYADARIVALALQKTEPGLIARLGRGTVLKTLGLIQPVEYHPRWLVVSGPVMSIARMRTADPERMKAKLLGPEAKPVLQWTDFDHLGDARDLAERALAAALDRRKGFSLLLHGQPGTGKTEFVRTLAHRLSAHPVFVGETDDDSGEPDRNERIAAFMLARAVAQRRGRTILAVDEADDLFVGVDHFSALGRSGSKVFMNRLVETAGVPVVWIVNEPRRMGPAVLRRMDLAIGFPQPARRMRNHMLGRALRRQGLKLPAGEVERLAQLDAPPAVLDRALHVAKLAGGAAAEVELATDSVMRLLKRHPAAPAIAPPISFDPALSAADGDLVLLAEKCGAAMRETGRRDFSFCLHGPPGTGKSAYARYVAERLGLDVIEKRASDLLGPYVGMTEARIAEAFREAADKRSMLILDEADSFLRDRAGARQSWEVSQVNEMLTWMERHPYPFVCTTNLMDSLDPATLRRFLFKVRFLAMSEGQARAAFRANFGVAAPAGIGGLGALTPGDFAVAARKAAVLGERDPARLLDLLDQELAARAAGANRPIGFAVR